MGTKFKEALAANLALHKPEERVLDQVPAEKTGGWKDASNLGESISFQKVKDQEIGTVSSEDLLR